jgi:hypothetical protein
MSAVTVETTFTAVSQFVNGLYSQMICLRDDTQSPPPDEDFCQEFAEFLFKRCAAAAAAHVSCCC